MNVVLIIDQERISESLTLNSNVFPWTTSFKSSKLKVICHSRLLDDNFEFESLLSTRLMVNQSAGGMEYLLQV